MATRATEPLTEAQVAEMEEQVATFRRQQQTEQELADAYATLAQRDRAAPLVEFVESDEYKAFVKQAETIRDSMIGDPLVQHLAGALISLSVFTTQAQSATERFAAAERRIEAEAGVEAVPEA